MTGPRAAAAALALAAALPMAACDGGYPSEDTPAFEPHGMDNVERIAALNDAGSREGTEGRWRYALEAGCKLQVERRSGLGRWRGEQLLLSTHVPQLAAATDGEPHRVLLLGAGDAAKPVFESSDRIDALQVELLLVLLRRDCAAPPADTG